MRKVFTVLGGLSFLSMYVVVQNMDTGAIGLWRGAIFSVVFLLAGVLCWRKADIFIHIDKE